MLKLNSDHFPLRVPERWFPGKFDLFFNSHQIWHICVVLAALIHWRSCMMMLEWRDASGGCAAPVTSSLSTLQTHMRDQGHDVFSAEEVWARLSHYVHEHLHSLGHGGLIPNRTAMSH